jgi:hypothetical protein
MWLPSLRSSESGPDPSTKQISATLAAFVSGMTFAKASRRRSVILYEGDKEMNLNRAIRLFVSLGMVLGAFGDLQPRPPSKPSTSV